MTTMTETSPNDRSPALLWIANMAWPGFGSLLVGQRGLAVVFGLAHWGCVAVTIPAFETGMMACAANALVASAVGHAMLGRDARRSRQASAR